MPLSTGSNITCSKLRAELMDPIKAIAIYLPQFHPIPEMISGG
jgi:hypothetical protein